MLRADMRRPRQQRNLAPTPPQPTAGPLQNTPMPRLLTRKCCSSAAACCPRQAPSHSSRSTHLADSTPMRYLKVRLRYSVAFPGSCIFAASQLPWLACLSSNPAATTAGNTAPLLPHPPGSAVYSAAHHVRHIAAPFLGNRGACRLPQLRQLLAPSWGQRGAQQHPAAAAFPAAAAHPAARRCHCCDSCGGGSRSGCRGLAPAPLAAGAAACSSSCRSCAAAHLALLVLLAAGATCRSATPLLLLLPTSGRRDNILQARGGSSSCCGCWRSASVGCQLSRGQNFLLQTTHVALGGGALQPATQAGRQARAMQAS